MQECFAVCTPGLEALLLGELRARGIPGGRRERGGVAFRATTRELYAANVWLRTASRVLVRVARFEARSFAELERHASMIDWSRWIADQPAAFRVSSSASRLFHTGAIAERLTTLLTKFGAKPPPDVDFAPNFVVRVERDVVTISADSSGAHLHRRGWRLATAKAPLRETLGAALVLASGWDQRAPLVDPLCGSGTIAIEAALLATGRAPGGHRDFAFQRWPQFEPGTWASVREEVRRAEREPANGAPLIIASDRDAGAVRAALENAARAGVSELVEIRRAALSEAATDLPKASGWVVTNPPYGTRVRGGDLRNLYATIGDLARGPLAEWHLALVIADRALGAQIRLPLEDRVVTSNGGIPVTFATSAPRLRR